jgi:periplasmic divalent cation tolerance protein
MGLPASCDHPALLVLCTCPDEAVATGIARALVSEGLAACVNRTAPVTSVYRWQGRLCEEAEQLLVVKTTPARYAALEMRLKALHPYELPEIIAIPVVVGSRQYLDWVAAATALAQDESNPLSVQPK